MRALYLKRHPLCEPCHRKGHTTAAQMVDHTVPIMDGGAIYSFDNLEAMCNRCHARKTQLDLKRRRQK